MNNCNFSVRQLVELDACTNCRLCADVCPAACAATNGELSAVYRLKGLKQSLKARAGLFRKLFARRAPSESEWQHYGDTVFRCTLCGNCEEVCPMGIRLKELWQALRQDLVKSDAYPDKIDRIRDNLAQSRNVFDEDNAERAEWVEDMADPPEDGYLKDRAGVVYFTGCVAAFFPMAQKIPMTLAEILDASEVDFTLLGEEEWCCGFPMLGAGLMDMFAEFRDHNIDALRSKGAETVVFACPSCYQMWREHYPAEFKIAHETEFLLDLIKQRKVPLHELSLTVTYHDPCDLGRGARKFDEPREIIRAIPGITFIELPRHRESCQCCGGGGNLEMVDAELAAEISRRKIDEVLTTGAQAVVTSCQQCVRTMATYVRRNKIALEVLDIAQLVHRALRK